MEYKKGDVSISVETIDGFGKNPDTPGLWIGTKEPNITMEVATFESKASAEAFCKWMDYFMGIGKREDVKLYDLSQMQRLFR